ncbi:THAP-type domain-containing protein, partial [Aphis craccivora]
MDKNKSNNRNSCFKCLKSMNKNPGNETKSNTGLIEASTPTVDDISVLSNETLLTKSPN